MKTHPPTDETYRYKINILVSALRAAQKHLEYCNYGDKWEKECAVEAKLPQIIQSALDKAAK